MNTTTFGIGSFRSGKSQNIESLIIENKLLSLENLKIQSRYDFLKKGLAVKILVQVDEDTCETKMLVDTEIIDCYSFVYERKTYDYIEDVDYILKDYIVLENGYVLSLKDVELALLIRRSYEDEKLIITLAPKFADTFEETLEEYDYKPLDLVLNKHLDFVSEMNNACLNDNIQSDKTHVNVIGEKEDGYAEEGMLSKEECEVADLGSPFTDDIISTDVLKSYKIDSVQSRYVYVNRRISKRKVYKLKDTDKLAIESPTPIFKPSDVFLVKENKAIIF